MERNRFRIREARPQEARLFLEIDHEAFSTDRFNLRQMRYLLRKARSVALVAEEAGQARGIAIGLLRDHPGGRRSGRVYLLAVRPPHRGRGVGKRLLTALIKRLRSAGAERIYLEVNVKNHRARVLYESLGFRVFAREPAYYEGGVDAFRMVLEGPPRRARGRQGRTRPRPSG